MQELQVSIILTLSLVSSETPLFFLFPSAYDLNSYKKECKDRCMTETDYFFGPFPPITSTRIIASYGFPFVSVLTSDFLLARRQVAAV